MTPIDSFEKPVLRAALDEIIRAHGLGPVLRAMLARVFRGRPPDPVEMPMNDHIRRDIGLGPMAPFDPWTGSRR